MVCFRRLETKEHLFFTENQNLELVLKNDLFSSFSGIFSTKTAANFEKQGTNCITNFHKFRGKNIWSDQIPKNTSR